jgi:hypothetical protein
VGILVGARSILAMFLSIHIGVLMDRSVQRLLRKCHGLAI